METILWPTDLSKGSLMAAKQVVSLAEKYQARIVVVYVAVDLCSYFPAYGNFPSQDMIGEFQGWEMEEARKKLETVCQEELRGCPNIKVRLVRGQAAQEILRAAENEGASLVVMTSRGHGLGQARDKATGLGSVARQVLEGSRVPVQIIYPEEG
jgi:nucleotide-binding universal stress UspA family protein